jgi:CRISPR/Cas system CMR-associated protein Cmr1 (group 7 of RAMP superfamily)
MSDTPISDSTPHNVAELGMLCRRLERELTASNTIIRQQQLLDEANLRLQDRIKRLDEALEAVAKVIGPIGKSTWVSDDELNQAWELYMKTKEAKP